VTACVFAVSADRPVVPGRDIYVTRTPEPGELYEHTYATLQPLFSQFESGRLMHVKTAADLAAAATEAGAAPLSPLKGPTSSKADWSASRKHTTGGSSRSSSCTTGATSWATFRQPLPSTTG
jgi:hypothetical protein